MSNPDHVTTNPAKRPPLLERLAVCAVVLAGAWLLDRLVPHRADQLLILSWLIAAMACGIALRFGRPRRHDGRHWWALPAWMLAGSALCFLAGVLTLGN